MKLRIFLISLLHITPISSPFKQGLKHNVIYETRGGYVGVYGIRVPQGVKTNYTTLIHYGYEVA